MYSVTCVRISTCTQAVKLIEESELIATILVVGKVVTMVSCKVCTEDFTLGGRAPLLLPCGHTFCRQCLDLIQSMPPARCPTCMMTLCGVALNHLTINYDLITTEENCLAADTSFLAHIQVSLHRPHYSCHLQTLKLC